MCLQLYPRHGYGSLRSNHGSNVVRARRRPAASSGPVSMEKLAARFIHALVSVGAEKVALGLQQVRWQARGAVPIVERKRSGEGGRRHAVLNRLNDGAAPGSVVSVQRLTEEIV